MFRRESHPGINAGVGKEWFESLDNGWMTGMIGKSCDPSGFVPPSFLMPMADSPGRNHYELLNVPRNASSTEIKMSYRQLLSLHPDKSDVSRGDTTRPDIDIGQLKNAFVTLSSPEHRLKYDSELSSRPDPSPSRSRPALIVSLEDFDDLDQGWTYNCRCGGQYTIGEDDMEKGVHLTACSSCSEVIWVGYEACPLEDDSTSPDADRS